MEAENYFEISDFNLDYSADNDDEFRGSHEEKIKLGTEQSMMQKIEIYLEERSLKSCITDVFDG